MPQNEFAGNGLDKTKGKLIKQKEPANAANELSEEKEGLLKKFKHQLIISGYSAQTQKVYFYYLKIFITQCNKPIDGVERDDIISFLAERKEKENASNATLALIHAALHFFFHEVLGKKIVDDIKTPKKAKNCRLFSQGRK